MNSFGTDSVVMDLECETIDSDVDSPEPKSVLVGTSQLDNEQTEAEFEAENIKANASNTIPANNKNSQADGVENISFEIVDSNLDSLGQKPVLVEVSQPDGEQFQSQLKTDEIKKNKSNVVFTNTTDIHADGVECNITEIIDSNVGSSGQKPMLVDRSRIDDKQTVVEYEAGEIAASTYNVVHIPANSTDTHADSVETFSNFGSSGQKPVLADTCISQQNKGEFEADKVNAKMSNKVPFSITDIYADCVEKRISEKPYGKDHSYSAVKCNKMTRKRQNVKIEQNDDNVHSESSIVQNKKKGKSKNMENMERNFPDLYVKERAKTTKDLSDTVKQTSAAENLSSIDEKLSSASRYFQTPGVLLPQLTAPISPLFHRPVFLLPQSFQRMGMTLPIQTPLSAVQSQVKPVRVFANNSVKTLLNRPQLPLQRTTDVILVTHQPAITPTAIRPVPLKVLPNQTQMSQFSAETRVLGNSKNLGKTTAEIAVSKSSSYDSCRTVSPGASKAQMSKLSVDGKTADVSIESNSKTGHQCTDEAAQNVVKENTDPEIIAMLPVTGKVKRIECVCCGHKNHLMNIDNTILKGEGFPEILFKYGGITKARYKDSFICRKCRTEVVITHSRVRKFFKKCKRYALKTGQITLTKIPGLTENESEILLENYVRTKMKKAQPQVVNNTQLNQAIDTHVLGHSNTSIPVSVVPGLPKTCEAYTHQVSSKVNNIRPSETPATKTLLTEKVVFDQLLKEKVSVDHDYEQSTSDEQRTGFMQKAEIEELKSNLYSDDKIDGTSLQPIISKYCGGNIQSNKLCQHLLLSREIKHAFQTAILKDTSFAALRLQARKGYYVSELLKKGHDNFSSFSWTVLFKEFCNHFPLVVKLLIAISNIPAEKLADAIPRLGMIYGLLMHLRDNNLNRVQRLISKCLIENLVPKQVFEQLSPMGLCLHYKNSYTLLRRFHTSPFNAEELRKNKAARENRKKHNIIASDKIRKRAAQFKFQGRSRGEGGNGRNSQFVPEVTAAEEEPPDKKVRLEDLAGDDFPARVYKTKGRDTDYNTLTPSQQNSAVLCEKTGKVKLKRKKNILSLKTCENEQSVSSWTPEDLMKCHINYSSDWISSSPYENLDIIPEKFLPSELSVEEENVLGDLNELLDLDIDVSKLGEEDLGKTIDNLTSTVTMLEESEDLVKDQTQETKMMYECAIDWLRVILQRFIRQQSGLSFSREEAIQMVNAFVRCFGFSKERGAAAERTIRVFTTKLTSTPALRVMKKDKNGLEKVVAVAEVPEGIGADKRLFEKLAGELLVEIPYSLYPDCMFGLLFYKTSVVITCLNITLPHIRKLQMNCPLTDRHNATAVYTKLYDLMKANERLEVMRFMKRLSLGPNTGADTQEKGQESKKSQDLSQAKATVAVQNKQQIAVVNKEKSSEHKVVESDSLTGPRKLMTYKELMALKEVKTQNHVDDLKIPETVSTQTISDSETSGTVDDIVMSEEVDNFEMSEKVDSAEMSEVVYMDTAEDIEEVEIATDVCASELSDWGQEVS